ncbi:MAG TPA: DUF397 domain-containing protein [Umezawaea sp.]|nr:DUF397 domain-containing protein [Umezawaea sp.]
MIDPNRYETSWRKSSYSGSDANCVEISFGSAVVGVRDSKRPEAGHLAVDATAFRSFVNHIKAS